MKDISQETVYFGQSGEANTLRTLDVAYGRAKSLGIQTILVATTTGETGVRASRKFKEFRVVTVTHSTGFDEPDKQELTEENRKAIEENGARILTCQHALGGINRAVRKRLGTYELDEIIAYTLRIFSQGMKVAIEMALMAADAGLVRTDKPVMAIAGTGSGADTAVVLIPANAQSFFDLKIVEIVCMPSVYHPNFMA